MSVARIAGLMTISIACAVGAQTVKVPIKTPIEGLVSMGAYRFVSDGGQPANTLWPLYARPGIFGGIVIVATWAELQPSSSDIAQSNTIDRALEAVREYNRIYGGAPLAVKLRVWGGFEAPPWAMTLDGQRPVTITLKDNKTRTLGHAWRPAYRKAWRDFQKMLAARYDNEPLIHEVAVTSCMTFTAEPFFIPDDQKALKQMHDAGFTSSDYRTCLKGAVEDYDGWKATRIEFPFNPFTRWTARWHHAGWQLRSK